MNEADKPGDDEIKIYSSDPGHRVEEPVEDLSREEDEHVHARRRFADIDARCREQIAIHPWTALAMASLAGGALGALAGFVARGRHR
ncbi:hypothetical protein [Azoarcus olearius]|uniref:Hypothetical membrane protein n=1 Tax=Azoarcus sp. (strain BH72) TaxID=418699 RepID=A1K693_AZOSB|nr:hypothetical protein [Azoarcus olearius]ANQ84919.1 hypothetical protein dqs_1881 [Azoarcus olearius]CAL94348.1 hypothetical membrane protein [Azoarcus olearius]